MFAMWTQILPADKKSKKTMIKLQDILLGNYDSEIQNQDVIRDEPQTHKIRLPLEIPNEEWQELKLLLGNSQDDAKHKLRVLLKEIINQMN